MFAQKKGFRKYKAFNFHTNYSCKCF